MSKTPKEVFSACKDTELLTHLAISKQIEAEDKSRKALVQELSDHVSSNGLHIMLKALKAKTLKNLASKLDWGDKKVPSQKGILAKKIYESMQSKPKKFLDERTPAELKEMLTELDIDYPDNKKEYAETILREADNMGLENLLSTQSIDRLKEFAKSCGLTVESSSLSILIDSIMNQEDFEAPKKEEKEKISKKKPALDKNITKTDLLAYYTRADLAKFCNDKDISDNGKKSELGERIINFLKGKMSQRRGKLVERREKKVRVLKKKDQKKRKSRKKNQRENLLNLMRGLTNRSLKVLQRRSQKNKFL